MQRTLALAACALAALGGTADAADWYVSAARGSGKKGSKEEPVRDLGVISDQVKAGDTVNVAQGTYLGRGRSSTARPPRRGSRPRTRPSTRSVACSGCRSTAASST